MSACEDVLDTLVARDHAVQFYGLDAPALAANVGRYFLNGLRRGETIIVIAEPKNSRSFLEYLDAAGINHRALDASGQLQMYDAGQTLDRFLVGGQPDARRFDEVIGSLVRAALDTTPGLCAYGEMVGVLWARGQYPAAIRLEQLWHRLMAEQQFQLFCGYEINLFDPELEIGLLDALLCAHTHLLPSGGMNELSSSLEDAIREVMGGKSERIINEASNFSGREWPQLSKPEALLFFLRKNMPAHAPRILQRAKEQYLASAGSAA